MFQLIAISEVLGKNYDSDGILLDIRSREEYLSGHLPMARWVPFEDIMHGKYVPEKEKPVFIYCATGSNSMLAAKKLDSMGVNVYSVMGGIMFYKGYLEKEVNKLWTMYKI